MEDTLQSKVLGRRFVEIGMKGLVGDIKVIFLRILDVILLIFASMEEFPAPCSSIL